MSDFRLCGHPVLSAGALLEIALAAGAEAFSRASFSVHDVSFEHPLWLATEGLQQLQTTRFPEDASCYSFQISSLGSGQTSDWIRHACGGITMTAEPDESESHGLSRWRSDCETPIAIDEFNRQVVRCRIEYRAGFQCLRRLWRGASQVLGEIEVPTTSHGATDHRASAEFLEACVQVALAVLPTLQNQELLVVERVTSMRVYGAAESPKWIHATLNSDQNPKAVNVVVANSQGTPLMVIEDMRFREIDEGQLPGAADEVDVSQQWRDADDGQRRRLVESQIRLQLARVLGSGAARHVLPDDRLVELGIDSMMAVELKLRLEAALGETLTDNLVFEFPTLRTLSEFLYHRLNQSQFHIEAESEPRF